MEKITKIAKLDPRVWGVTINFKVLKKEEPKEVKFKDETSHKVCDLLVADDSASIILNLWDDSIGNIDAGKFYQITEARLTVFNNVMKLTPSRKSEILPIQVNFEPNEKENMSEKKFKPAKVNFYRKNDKKDFGY